MEQKIGFIKNLIDLSMPCDKIVVKTGVFIMFIRNQIFSE